MSRPAAAVQSVIKAYDVRGLVGEQIDEQFVSEVGAAFARLVRDGAQLVVIGHDMRASSPPLVTSKLHPAWASSFRILIFASDLIE